MLKNNLKCFCLYIIVINVCILFLNWYDKTFPYSLIVYEGGDLLLFLASILLVLGGFFLKNHANLLREVGGVILLAVFLAVCLSVLAFEYDYISSILHQNTPNFKIYTEEFLGIIDTLCLPLWWFMRIPDSIRSINKYCIIFSSIYPSTMIFIGMQLKKLVFIFKNQNYSHR